MKQKSLKKNFIYNILYQVLIIILPLITTPYISRVIGPTGTGINSYTYSITYYFVMFSMLGINNYGNRLIAKCRNDSEKMSKEFSSLFRLHVLLSIIAILVYLIYVMIGVNEYKIYFLIQTVYLVSSLFDINWLFFGLEEFKITVTRNTIIKIISTLSIFLLVKKSDDLIIYILILGLSSLISNLLLFPFLKKNKVKLVKVDFKEITKHFKPLVVLFIPVIAVSIYKLMDKIMLGSMIDVKEVGLYEYGERIINLPMTIITALGTVMLPRISNLVANKEEEKIKKYIDKSMKFVLFLSIPLCFGIIIVANDFIPLFLGNGYMKTSTIVKILAITIPIISWANIIRTQYFLPKEMDKEYIRSVFLGAIINFILNIFLIKKYQSLGASIATVFAELVVMLYQTYKVRKFLPINNYLKYFAEFFIKSFIMSIIIYTFSLFDINIIIKLIFQIMCGVIIYGIINIKYILETLNIKKFINMTKRRS